MPVRSGLLLLDKPQGMTSHDVVSRVRKVVGSRRVGHAGTLDPMATGLLVIGVNRATRLLTYLVGLDKEYLATIRLGASTPSDDADSPIDERADPDRLAGITHERLHDAVKQFTGEISQVPSTVSAIKVDGKRAYARARAGETVELAARPVTVSAFDILEVRHSEFVDVDVRVECSTGTYIRALARDLGRLLGVGGHLTALRRTRVGPFEISASVALDSVDPEHDLMESATVARRMFRVVELSAQDAIDLGHGKRPATSEQASAPGDQPVAAIDPNGRLIGLVVIDSGALRTLVNFPPEEDDA